MISHRHRFSLVITDLIRQLFVFLFNWHLIGHGFFIHDKTEVAKEILRCDKHDAIEAAYVTQKSHDCVDLPLMVVLSVGKVDLQLRVRLIFVVAKCVYLLNCEVSLANWI